MACRTTAPPRGWSVGAYFLAYLPYATAVKVLSLDFSVGAAVPSSGLVLLPAVAVGQLLAMPFFLHALGWCATRAAVASWPGRSDSHRRTR
ncbi:MAG: hypothetical protein ACM3ZF_16265 [Mycobacterium leprae]